MQTGLQTIEGNVYYLGKDGAVQTGWKNINGNKYYFEVKGGIYKTKDMEYLIEQFSNTIEYYEEQMKQEKEERIIKEIVEQIENRNKKTIAEKVRRYLCGR